MTSTWYYHVIDGSDVRAPIDLDKRVIDWMKVETWHEPPSKVNDAPMRGYICERLDKLYLMRCEHCGYTKRQKRTTICRKCGSGVMQAIEAT